MGRRRAAGSSSSSSFSTESSSHYHCTDLRLGLLHDQHGGEEEEESESGGSLFVKVYMEGIGIGRKLNLLANDGYHHLISTLHFMFNIDFSNTILWSGYGDDGHGSGHYAFVLTYQDKEGDWMMVGDVPWEMFLSTVQRLKITRPFGS